MNCHTPIYDRLAPVLADRGMSFPQMSKALNVPETLLRDALRRRQGPRDSDDYSRAILDMPHAEVVPYLLDCIEVLTGVDPTQTPTQRWGFHLPRTQERILGILEMHAGKTVRKEALYLRLHFDDRRDKLPTQKSVQSYIARLRQNLREHRPEWQIHTEIGYGYWLERATSASSATRQR